MSQIPPPLDPIPYAGPTVRLPPRRPTSVTVIAIIAIIWGSIAVLGTFCSLPQALGVQFGPNPATSALAKDSAVKTFQVTALGLSFVLAIVELWGGIASLSLKQSGRKLLIGFAIAQLAIGLLAIPAQVLFIYPRMVHDVEAAVGANSPVAQGVRYGFFGGLAFGLLALIWPVLILVFMNRPNVKAAFEQGM